MRKKLKDNGGLTMVEMLCAVAILVLLCLMMNTGINMAVKTYRDITAESEAELLVSTLSDALADKLRYAVVTEKKDAGATEYTTFISKENTIDTSGNVSAVTLDAGQVKVDGKRLLPEGAYGAWFLPDGSHGATGSFASGYIGEYTVEQVKDDSGNEVPLVTYNSTTETFTVKFTVTAEEANITKTAEFTVRCLNPKKEGTTP